MATSAPRQRARRLVRVVLATLVALDAVTALWVINATPRVWPLRMAILVLLNLPMGMRHGR